MAHELLMGLAGVFDDGTDSQSDNPLIRAQNIVLDRWWEMYGYDLSIFLPDTFGTPFALRHMSEDHARDWKGFRGDSGNLIEEGRRIIEFYKKFGIDPKTKLYVPSDGLDVGMMIVIDQELGGQIQLANGWGTNLTNDWGVRNISLVVKAIRANDKGLVKLSNNLAKATGQPIDILYYQKLAEYDNKFNETCRY